MLIRGCGQKARVLRSRVNVPESSSGKLATMIIACHVLSSSCWCLSLCVADVRVQFLPSEPSTAYRVSSSTFPPLDTIRHLFQCLAIHLWHGNAGFLLRILAIRPPAVDGISCLTFNYLTFNLYGLFRVYGDLVIKGGGRHLKPTKL